MANDLIALMDVLGHKRFAVVGHDTGFVISYALAADHSDRVDRVALAEIPGPPLSSHSPPVFVPSFVNDRLWHIPLQPGRDVARAADRRAGGDLLPTSVMSSPSREASCPRAWSITTSVSSPTPTRCAAALGFYRALDATLAQNDQRAITPLAMPVLAIGGEVSHGEHVGQAMASLASDLQSAVMPGAGHWLAEQSPEELLAALTTFLAPYRDGPAAAQTSEPQAATVSS